MVENDFIKEFLNTPLADISVANLTNIITKVNKPINDKLDKINEGYDKRMSGLEGRIKILETENNRKGGKIETLTEIIVNMQKKSLNVIDGNTRSNNGNERVLVDDRNKIKQC